MTLFSQKCQGSIVYINTFLDNFTLQLPIQGVWPDSGDDKSYTKEFAAIAIDCLRPPLKRAKLADICWRLEVMKSTYSCKSSKLYFN